MIGLKGVDMKFERIDLTDQHMRVGRRAQTAHLEAFAQHQQGHGAPLPSATRRSPTPSRAHVAAAPFDLRKQFLRQLLKQALPIAIAVGFVALFMDNMAALDLSAIWAAVQTVSILQWCLALVATAASFWAVGRYDAVIHRHLGTGISRDGAMRSGIAAIAVSQTTGFGLFTGALARWRLLPEITMWQATQISAAVAISFLGGLAVVLSIVAILFPFPIHGAAAHLVFLPLLGFIALITASLLQPKIAFRGRTFTWPSIAAIFAITGLALADTLAAGAALYALLPPSLELSFMQLYPAFLAAFACALISGTPGGVGPFEITLMMLLPTVPAEPLLAAILAYRAIYYAGPALLGALVLARGPAQNLAQTRTNPPMRRDVGGTAWLTRPLEIAVHNAPRAEANLLRQADKLLLRAPSGAGSLLAAERGQTLIALGDPLCTTDAPALLCEFKQTAEAQNRLPFLYKISGRLAVTARKLGYIITPVSSEAWLRPARFDLSTSPHRQLRRKLRKAEKSGITVKALQRHADMHLAMGEMTRVAQDWAAEHGGERGFTMGVFEPAYVQTQQCFLAYQDEKLVAFVTFSAVAREWTLDLMRHSAELPDGTMHALVAEAIAAAAEAEIPRLSLASVPWRPALCAPRLIQGFRGYFARASGGSGLTQFKNSFAPQWEVLYMAAPTRLSLLLGAFDVLRSVVCQPAPRLSAPPVHQSEALFAEGYAAPHKATS